MDGEKEWVLEGNITRSISMFLYKKILKDQPVFDVRTRYNYV